MTNQNIKYIAITVLITPLTLLQGCATSVSRLSVDGKSDEIIFPNIEKSAWIKEGTYPNIDNLRSVAPEMTKHQLYALLGHPHFAEGIGKVREWDYIFNFRQIEDKAIETCQYKIIYSTNMLLKNTYWKPESCAQRLAVTTIKPQVIVERTIEKFVQGTEVIKMKMNADGMFDFDQSGIAHLKPGGIEKLNRLSENLISGEFTQLIITGHTDRLGDDNYNMNLSRARAETIRQYLVGKKIPAERILTYGVGKSSPLIECKQNVRNEALIRCLAPNRRFEIEAWSTKKI